jgi:hypothetical protein
MISISVSRRVCDILYLVVFLTFLLLSYQAGSTDEMILGHRFAFPGIPRATLTIIPGYPFKFGNNGVKMNLVIVPPQGWDVEEFSCQMHKDAKVLHLKWSMPAVPLTEGFVASCHESNEANKAYDDMLKRLERIGYRGQHTMTYSLPARAIYQKEIEWHECDWGTGSAILVVVLLSVEESVVRTSRTIHVPVKKLKLTPYVAPAVEPTTNGNGGHNIGGHQSGTGGMSYYVHLC